MSAFDQVAVTADENSVSVTFERSLYPLDVIYGASYVFIDRCFVLLDTPAPGKLCVSLRGRDKLSADSLQTLAGEFGNEVLTQLWRQETIRQNLSIIEVVTARALAGAQAPANTAALSPSPPTEASSTDLADAFDDPLGIAVPWEEKYGASAKVETTGDEKK
jgi:His-Xaa-Ser system protein HxsD